MNCNEVQELTPLWLSGELEGARRTGFAAHLAGCDRCARWLAEQAALDARILHALRDEDPDTKRTERAVSRRITWERRRWLVAAGVAAAVLAALLIGFGLRRQEQPDRLYVDAARDHRLEVMEHQPRRWRSEPSDIQVLAELFGLTNAKALALAPAGYRLVHAKTCGLEGRAALHLVYTDGAREISVYVRRGTNGLQQAGSAEIGGERLASADGAEYSAIVVTTGQLDECRQMARRTANLL